MDTKLVSAIDDVARSRLATVRADDQLISAAKLLADTQISLVIVCDAGGAMAGIITKTNIVRLIGACGASACMKPAAEVMTSDVAYCRPTDSLHDVLSMMERRGFVHVPVIDENSRPLGVINARDALRTLMADGEYESSLLRDYVMGIGYQ